MTDPFDELRAAMKACGVFLDKDRPIPLSPTPMLVSEPDYAEISATSLLVLSALEKAAQMTYTDPDLWAYFPELHAAEELIRLPTSTNRVIDLARFDLAIVKDGGFKMLESNSQCPGGLTVVGDINTAFRASRQFQEGLSGAVVEMAMDDQRFFVDYLASLVPPGTPVVMAFISSRHRRIATDLDRLTELAKERGHTAIRCDVQDLEYNGHRLTHNGSVITTAFMKFDTVVTDDGQLDLGIYAPDHGPDQPFIRAVLDRSFKYVNSFTSQLLIESKRLLAMLFVDKVRAILDRSELEAVDSLVARTYALSAGGLEQFGGRERLLREKDHWVLKKVSETRGRGVYIGRFKTDEEWAQIIDTPYIGQFVTQEAIELAVHDIHMPVFEEPGRFDAYTDIGLFMVGGKATGFLCRASTLPVVNVGQSGAMRPTLITMG